MKKIALTWAVSLLAAVACRDLEGPPIRGMQIPKAVSRSISGPPDTTFFVPAERGAPITNTYMIQFPWDTYVTLEAIGTVWLNAKDKLEYASSNYIWPSRAVLATGQVDNHTDGVCALGLSMSDNYGPLPSFGVCGSTPKIDTVLSLKLQKPWINRGPLPVKHYYECSETSNVCHYLNGGDGSYVRERPIPVTLNKLTVTPATLDTGNLSAHNFKGSISPDSLTLNGVKGPHPYRITLWQWIGADSTRDPNLTGSGKGPGCTIIPQTLLCTYSPPEAGTMVLKAFVGGWEQTSTVTVQCLTAPADSVLNDSINNFAVRTGLLDAFARANPDSAPGAGYDPNLGRGWRHETGVVIWHLPNGGYDWTPYEDPEATECHMRFDPNVYLHQTPPVPGATPFKTGHIHPSVDGEDVYGCDSVKSGNSYVKVAKAPGDGLPVPTKLRDDSTGGGSPADWMHTAREDIPSYVLGKEGDAWRLDPTPDSLPNYGNPNRFRALKKRAGRCTWPQAFKS